jgi:hypothetical protein
LIEPSILVAKGFGLQIRPCLGASHLNGIEAPSPGTKRVPEPTESVSLLRIGPDHKMPPAAHASSMDIAVLGPFLESVVAYPEFVRQVATL